MKRFSEIGRDGKRLEDIFKERGYSQEPEVIKGVINYLELHIEQGRVLESEELELGIVNAIAGNERLKINIKGDAEYSGATPMDLRLDALCAGAEIILAIEKIGQDSAGKSGVATVGELHNYPNSMNVIPDQLELAVDIRSIDSRLTREMRLRTEELVEEICQRRGLTYEIEILSPTKAVSLDKDLYKKLSNQYYMLYIA